MENFKIALAGNPNSGKSSLFNQLTGLKQKIGNFPGVTIEKKMGTLVIDNQKISIIDLPGTYSLYPNSSDERIVLHLLTNPKDELYPDAIIFVADASQIERHLLLFTQIRDLNFPCIFCLTMNDIADEKGIKIDIDKLQQYLNTPVIAINPRASNNQDFLKKEIKKLVQNPKTINAPYYNYTESEKKMVEALRFQNEINSNYQAILWIHHFKNIPYLSISQKNEIEALTLKENYQDIKMQIEETMSRFNKIHRELPQFKKIDIGTKSKISDKIDDVLTNKIAGPIIFFSIMFAIFQVVFNLSSYPMDWIEKLFLNINNYCKEILPKSWLTDLFTDGIIAGLSGIVVFIPQIALLFFLISALEDFGYMSRAVYMFDKSMQRFGLNGRSIVAFVAGGACAIPAIMSTRTISNWKERIITIMVLPVISCSARIPVFALLVTFIVPNVNYLGFINSRGLVFTLIYVVSVVAALTGAYILKKLIKSNEQTYLIIELPEYRLPNWKNVLMIVKEKVKSFVKEAGKVILIVSVALWFLASFGPGTAIQVAESEAIAYAKKQNYDIEITANYIASKKLETSYAGIMGKTIEPLIKPLGFDWKIGIAIISSFAAREVFVGTMATIYAVGNNDDATLSQKMKRDKWTETQNPIYTVASSLALLIFYLFALQCISTVAVVKKETGGWKWPIIQFIAMSSIAYILAYITFQLLN
jgi:ferrous iron transport protein B